MRSVLIPPHITDYEFLDDSRELIRLWQKLKFAIFNSLRIIFAKFAQNEEPDIVYS